MKINHFFTFNKTGEHGFTITDLLVVIAVVSVLTVLLLPALASTKPNSSAFQCLQNHRQLVVAWQMYAEDNFGNLVASAGQGSSFYNGRPIWMTGTTSGSSTWDTNTDIVNSPLWVYVGEDASIFKCPADMSTVTVAGKIFPRVRSLSMSQVFDSGLWLTADKWRTYAKTAEVVKPAKTFIFIDENPGSINDGGFASQCNGLAGTNTGNAPALIDVPASYHNKAGGISFADGHTEMHRWKGGHILNFGLQFGSFGSLLATTPGDLDDFTYLAQNTTVLK
jgi:prepilin-type processing-associated H-X9-DG protein